MKYTMLIMETAQQARRDLVQLSESTELFNRLLFADSEAEALGHLERNDVDMISCEWHHDTMYDRIAFLKKLDRSEDWADIPVIAFSRQQDVEMRVVALENGISDCPDYSTSAKELAARLRLQLKLKEKTANLRKEKSHLAKMALTDMLTGTYNRAYFDASLEAEISRSRRGKRPVSLLMIDMDHFKSINDTYGHQFGDTVLQTAASVLKKTTRCSDIVCRYGGEEFAVILPDTSSRNALITAEKIREAFASLVIPCGETTLGVSVSIGISGAGGLAAVSASELISQADRALYQSKHNGRNRCELFQPVPTVIPVRPHPYYPQSLAGCA